MKKIFIIVIAAMVAGCSALPPVNLPFLNTGPTPTVGPSNTPVPTVTQFPTPTATRDLFAVNTAGPTQVPSTQDPNITLVPPTRTPTDLPTTIPTITLLPIDQNLFTPSPQIFRNILRTTDQIVWGSTCDGDRNITFTVDAVYTGKLKLKYVLLFTRLQDKYSGRNTDWQTGAIMKDNDRGKYFYTLELNQIDNYEYYEDAWLQYQFVASTVGLTVLGRSVVDQSSVSISHCSFLNMLP